ncbi:Mediator of RNA polymerase II transcription subunit 7 [Hypsizygus marmoreus]|uniref:Mediator of RNA polymerase II transcription subunit 7 n=1 Tax=Hypsizygus marmoreus TaxID=39966 RepID=A0A369K7R5_HYPMA|nr:Mediator of RNA polymerase II transcription subunit 7 [Hypsizygus marmoreus]
MDDEEAELRNPFPSPPSHYTKYTSHNLKLLALLHERTSDPESNQHEVLADQTDIPDWPLTQLEKPRVDWILEEPEAYYDVFGDRWFVKEKIPSLAELGGNQLYPADPSTDRRPALLSILRSLLVTFSSLTSSLLAPPPSPSSTTPPDWQRHVEWITVLSQNIMAAANDLRPVQARGNLELMMRRQVELRRSETELLHSKCEALEARLADLRKSLQDLPRVPSLPTAAGDLSAALSKHPMNSSSISMDVVSDTDLTLASSSGTALNQNDVLHWAEEVG